MKARKLSQKKSSAPPGTASANQISQGMHSALEIVGKSRRERKLKLLQKLKQKLKYPNESESRQLARLARVPDDERFEQHIREIILDAHLNDLSLKNLSTPDVRTALESIASAALNLEGILRAGDVCGKGTAAYAGFLLEIELAKIGADDGKSLLPQYMLVLHTLAHAAKRAASSLRSRHGPKALTGFSAFDLFIESLLMAAWQRNGKWTIYRSADQTYTGTLLEAITLLQKYLPKNFFPGGTPGRSIENVRRKLRDHITKNTDQRR